jgi:hypothetical protein
MVFRQSVPGLGLSLEKATDAVPDDGLYYVILHGEKVLATSSKERALSSYRQLLQQFGGGRSAAATPSREEILRKLKAEADVSSLQAARSRAKRAHATHRRGGVSRWES